MPERYKGDLRSPNYMMRIEEIDAKYHSIGMGICRNTSGGALLENNKGETLRLRGGELGILDLLILNHPRSVSLVDLIKELEITSASSFYSQLSTLKFLLRKILPEKVADNFIVNITPGKYKIQLEEL